MTTKKTMPELRVMDLRSELEKRGLDKTGVKAALIERLSQALRDASEDVDTFEFEVQAEPRPLQLATPTSVAEKPVTKRVNERLARDVAAAICSVAPTPLLRPSHLARPAA